MAGLSHENKFDSCENEPAGRPRFHMNGFREKTRFEAETKTNSEMVCLKSRASALE